MTRPAVSVEDVTAELSKRLRRGQTVDQLVSVGERTGWWTPDDVDWAALGHDGSRPAGWTLDGDNQTPTEGTAPEASVTDAAGTAPDLSGSGHGNAGPDARPQVSPSRSHSGEGGGLGASDAPAESPTTGTQRTCEHCSRRYEGRRADSKYCSSKCTQGAWRARQKARPATPQPVEPTPQVIPPSTVAPQTPLAAADTGEDAAALPPRTVAVHRPAPPAAGADLLAVGLSHPQRTVRAAAARAARAIDDLVSALAASRHQ